jgi:hypothetical protein
MGKRSLAPAVGGGGPSKAIGKGAKKGGKRGHNQRPQHVATTTSRNNDDKEADDSDEKYVVATERDFKHQA